MTHSASVSTQPPCVLAMCISSGLSRQDGCMDIYAQGSRPPKVWPSMPVIFEDVEPEGGEGREHCASSLTLSAQKLVRVLSAAANPGWRTPQRGRKSGKMLHMFGAEWVCIGIYSAECTSGPFLGKPASCKVVVHPTLVLAYE